VPAKTGDQVIPLWISIPNAGSPGGGVRPGGGWPVVIYQHGLTTNRATLLALADSLAAVGFAAVAIDLPLHGLAPDHPLRVAEEAALNAGTIPLPMQRTFDVDYVTQDATTGSITAQAPDGIIDSSGRHIVNLASLLTTRDNFRQAVADLFAAHGELGNMDYDGNPGNQPDFDTANVRFVGWSLGGIVGSIFLALEPNVGAAVLPMPGGGFAKLADGSPNLGPEIAAGLQAAAGIAKGTADYESFLGAAQTVLDSGDPLNYAGTDATTGGTPGDNGGTTLNATRGVMMFEVVGDGINNLPDQTIPNHVGTFALGFADAPAGTVPSPTGGTDPLHREMGLNNVTASALTAGAGASAETRPLLRFTAGYHGSIADPSGDPAANAAVTTVMQGAMATHIASNGTGFNVDPLGSGVDFASVVEDAPP
jgi:dienelactone hydrolase